MIARVLPFAGTAILGSAVVILGIKALDVFRVEPTIETPVEDSFAGASESHRESQQAMARRPEVFYAAITERPLFDPSRRPFVLQETTPAPQDPVPVAVEPEKPPEELPPPQIVLQGVITKNDRNSALIGIDGKPSVWVSEGDFVDGWKINEIGSDWIEISQKARNLRVEMYK
ncbi:MAG TPA: hypothetical protein ENJ91_05690 [Rhodobacteraceae bacterium]|nr:hypothetical protein [Paracoccaceae bacterium]